MSDTKAMDSFTTDWSQPKAIPQVVHFNYDEIDGPDEVEADAAREIRLDVLRRLAHWLLGPMLPGPLIDRALALRLAVGGRLTIDDDTIRATATKFGRDPASLAKCISKLCSEFDLKLPTSTEKARRANRRRRKPTREMWRPAPAGHVIRWIYRDRKRPPVSEENGRPFDNTNSGPANHESSCERIGAICNDSEGFGAEVSSHLTIHE